MTKAENAALFRIAPSLHAVQPDADLSADPRPLPALSALRDIALQQTRIAYGAHRFDVFHTDPRDHIFRILANTGGFYESEFLAALSEYVQPGELVVDAGANIGNHTLFFAGVLGCRVASFEPGETALRLLQHNILANGLGSLVEVWPYAVAQEAGQFSPDGFDAVEKLGLGALTLRADADGGMRGMPLDAAAFGQPVKLIKIDVEGMEIEVLRGAERILLRDRPVICVECDDLERFNRMFDYLLGLGFLAIESYNYTATHVFVPVTDPSRLEARLSRRLATRYIAHGHQIHALSGRLAQVENLIRRIQLASRAAPASSH